MPMKILSSNSRFNHGILLFLLLFGLVATVFSLHNFVLILGSSIPITPILFILLSSVCGILLFQQAISAKSLSHRISDQLEILKKSIEQSKAEEKKQAEAKKDVKENIVIDFEEVSRSLIPEEPYSSEEEFAEKLLSNTANKFDVVQGLVFLKNHNTGKYSFSGGYAFFSEEKPREFIEGETLSGQVAKNKIILILNDVPDNYITVLSGLGKGSPKHLVIIPVTNSQNECIGIIELASFKAFDSNETEVFKFLGLTVGKYLENISLSIKE